MRIKNLLLIVLVLIFVFICPASAQNTWTQKANLTGIQRAALIAFSIDSVGYVGLGYNFSQPTAQQTDLWKYSPATDSWTQMASFPTGGVSGASAFSIGSNGYVAGGYSSSASAVVSDLWEYNSMSNSWTQKTSCPGPGRDYAVAFSINGKGYFGTGYDASSNNFDDFWEYNPLTDSWLQRATVPGSPRSSAVGFSIGSKGYIGSGYIAGGVFDFWQYNPATNTWTQKANIGSQGISDACGFAVGGEGYICTGYVNSNVTDMVMEYDTLADTWTPVLSLTGGVRSNSVGFTIGNKGYVSCGNDVSFSPLNDLWEYTPNSIPTSVNDENTFEKLIQINPNPAVNECSIKNAGCRMQSVEIFDVYGNYILLIQPATSNQQPVIINVSQWKSGVYFVRINADGKSAVKKFVKE